MGGRGQGFKLAYGPGKQEEGFVAPETVEMTWFGARYRFRFEIYSRLSCQ